MIYVILAAVPYKTPYASYNMLDKNNIAVGK